MDYVMRIHVGLSEIDHNAPGAEAVIRGVFEDQPVGLVIDAIKANAAKSAKGIEPRAKWLTVTVALSEQDPP